MATTVREILDIDNILNKAQQQGIQQGLQKAIIGLLDILDSETISNKTGVPLEEVIKLREEHQTQH